MSKLEIADLCKKRSDNGRDGPMKLKATTFISVIATIAIMIMVACSQTSCGFPGGVNRIPDAIAKAGIRLGEGSLIKSVFIEDKGFGAVSDIVFSELDPLPGEEIGIASPNGVVFTDRAGAIKAKVKLGIIGRRVNFVDVESDGVTEYMVRGEWAGNPGLYSHNGKLLWRYGGMMPGVDDMAAGDVDGDHILEFAVGFNGGGGVHLVDKNGKTIWQFEDANVWHVEMLDTNRDGKDEIVHSNASGVMSIRDGEGAPITSKNPGPYFSEFSVVEWPGEPVKKYAILADDNTIWLIGFDGSVAKKINIPDSGPCNQAMGVAAKLQADKPEYLAVLVGFECLDRSILYVFNPEDNLIYEEVFEAPGGAIAKIASSDGGTDLILVGGYGVVWRYEMAK